MSGSQNIDCVLALPTCERCLAQSDLNIHFLPNLPSVCEWLLCRARERQMQQLHAAAGGGGRPAAGRPRQARSRAPAGAQSRLKLWQLGCRLALHGVRSLMCYQACYNNEPGKEADEAVERHAVERPRMMICSFSAYVRCCLGVNASTTSVLAPGASTRLPLDMDRSSVSLYLRRRCLQARELCLHAISFDQRSNVCL